jgi:hypothetical protein
LEFTNPIYSWIILGLFPTDLIIVGEFIILGIIYIFLFI